MTSLAGLVLVRLPERLLSLPKGALDNICLTANHSSNPFLRLPPQAGRSLRARSYAIAWRACSVRLPARAPVLL
jgi:hypothetical protein